MLDKYKGLKWFGCHVVLLCGELYHEKICCAKVFYVLCWSLNNYWRVQ